MGRKKKVITGSAPVLKADKKKPAAVKSAKMEKDIEPHAKFNKFKKGVK